MVCAGFAAAERGGEEAKGGKGLPVIPSLMACCGADINCGGAASMNLDAEAVPAANGVGTALRLSIG